MFCVLSSSESTVHHIFISLLHLHCDDYSTSDWSLPYRLILSTSFNWWSLLLLFLCDDLITSTRMEALLFYCVMTQAQKSFDVASWSEDKLAEFAFCPFKLVPVSPRRVISWCSFIIHQHSRRPSLIASILYLENLLIYLEKGFAYKPSLGKSYLKFRVIKTDLSAMELIFFLFYDGNTGWSTHLCVRC